MKYALFVLVLLLSACAIPRRVARALHPCEPDGVRLKQYGCLRFGYCGDRANVFTDPENGDFWFVEGKKYHIVPYDQVPHHLRCKPR